MKIAILGYGKMGKAIESIALESGHEIVLKINSSNSHELTIENLKKADVAIEFTQAQTAVHHILTCFEAGIPVVCGSTGWLENRGLVDGKCMEKNGCFFYASNFSIGVNLFFELNKKLARLMADQEYVLQLEEIHHTEKKDAPSGTAISLAEDILKINPRKKTWVNSPTDNLSEIPILSRRIDPAPGTHIVKYFSEIDEIEIMHTAKSRKGFAAGALAAAQFVLGKKGIFSMQDLLF